MKIRPLHDRILVKRLDEETKTSGGLFIPDSAKEKPIQAKVIAVGAGKRDKDGKVIALDVKAGDKVLFSKYSGTEVKIDGEEHLIMREEDLLAILDCEKERTRTWLPKKSFSRRVPAARSPRASTSSPTR
jgi:chaperonin GroES